MPQGTLKSSSQAMIAYWRSSALNGFFPQRNFRSCRALSRVRQILTKGTFASRLALLGDLHRLCLVPSGNYADDVAIGRSANHPRTAFQQIWHGRRERARFCGTPVALGSLSVLLRRCTSCSVNWYQRLSALQGRSGSRYWCFTFQWFPAYVSLAIDLLWSVAESFNGDGVPHTSTRSAFHRRAADQIRGARTRMLRPGEEKFIVSASKLDKFSPRDHVLARMHSFGGTSLDEVMRAFATRSVANPVYRGSGITFCFIHIKDIIWILLDRERRLEENLPPPPFDLRRVLREVLIVPKRSQRATADGTSHAHIEWPCVSMSLAVFWV